MKGLNGNLSRRLSRVEVVKLSACFKCLVYLFVFLSSHRIDCGYEWIMYGGEKLSLRLCVKK